MRMHGPRVLLTTHPTSGRVGSMKYKNAVLRIGVGIPRKRAKVKFHATFSPDNRPKNRLGNYSYLGSTTANGLTLGLPEKRVTSTSYPKKSRRSETTPRQHPLILTSAMSIFRGLISKNPGPIFVSSSAAGPGRRSIEPSSHASQSNQGRDRRAADRGPAHGLANHARPGLEMERRSAGDARKCRRHGQADRGKSGNTPAKYDRSGGFGIVSEIRPGARRRAEEPDFIIQGSVPAMPDAQKKITDEVFNTSGRERARSHG
jgi:hypothetical protein